MNVPHDWSIEGPFEEKNPAGGAGAFLPAGVGWYRKHFTLPADYARRRVFIEFDGVMANSEVWINGRHLGKRPYGYVSFRYDLTGSLFFGENQPNVLAVRADNSAQPASRWYSGAGIYRHVRLVATDSVHIDHWGTFVTTPKVESAQAVVYVQTTVVNQSDVPREVAVQMTILAPDGQAVQTAETTPQTIPAGKSTDFPQEIPVNNPQLWDLDRPLLYRAVVKVCAGSAVLDEEATTFGIRDFRFEADTGFWLNGKNFKIKGVGLHHDCGALGAAAPLRAWQRRLEALKQIGCNAVRTVHNPPAPEFFDLCDQLGLLVMDEFFDCWTVGKNSYDMRLFFNDCWKIDPRGMVCCDSFGLIIMYEYFDLWKVGKNHFDYHLFFKEWSKIDARDIVRRDRNHPSVILYCVGNEIRDTRKAELAKEILKGLIEICHGNDPTRPVTQALFRPEVSHDFDNGLADMLDVIGTNYREKELLAAHQAKPTRKIIGTEQGHDRRVWLTLRDNPSEAGQFLWTGIDYLGESRNWPIVASGAGLLDLTGAPKPMAYQRQSWWSDKPMVHATRRISIPRPTPPDPGFEPLDRQQALFSDWTPQKSDPHEENVEVYSNCEDVELILNGKTLGSQAHNADDAPRTWKVPFAPGTIKAIGKNKGEIVATHELRTAGKPSKIILTADNLKLAADWDDVCYVTAAVADENNVPHPSANDLITFKLEGPGVIAGVENGDRSSHEPFQASQRNVFQGRCVAIIKATAPSGRIILSASAPIWRAHRSPSRALPRHPQKIRKLR